VSCLSLLGQGCVSEERDKSRERPNQGAKEGESERNGLVIDQLLYRKAALCTAVFDFMKLSGCQSHARKTNAY
jgi:hypothetical protein